MGRISILVFSLLSLSIVTILITILFIKKSIIYIMSLDSIREIIIAAAEFDGVKVY